MDIGQQLDILRQYESIGEWDSAESLCLHLLRLFPRNVNLLIESAKMAARRCDPSAAETLLYRALSFNPLNSPAYRALALARYEQGDLEDAERYFRKALLVKPRDGEACRHLGTLLNERGKFHEAALVLAEAHRQDPTSGTISCSLADSLYGTGNYPDAYALYHNSLEQDPDNANTLVSLAAVCERLDRMDEALEYLARARVQAPKNPMVYLNLGGVCQGMLKLDEALSWYRKALALRPGYPTARWNICQIELIRGNFREGFLDFDSRFHTSRPVCLRKNSLPPWSGEPAVGKRVLVQTEQAFGDAIQFVRYIPLLAEMGLKVTLENRLTPLNGLFNSLQGLESITDGAAVSPPCECSIPMLSLPRLLSTTLESIPDRVPYLVPSPEKIQRWQARLTGDRNLKVGICWAGRRFPDHRRSIPAGQLGPLTSLQHISWYSLQVDETSLKEYQDAALPPLLDLTGGIQDFEDTAAFITCLDLVITIDSAVAHLAGALAAPTWVLLPFAPDWRWLLERDDSPWYPTMRLFRQPRPGDWSAVIASVAAQLEKINQ